MVNKVTDGQVIWRTGLLIDRYKYAGTDRLNDRHAGVRLNDEQVGWRAG